MKKILSIIVCIFMLIPFAVVTKGETISPPSLSGKTYTISSASQLRWLSGVTSGTVKKGSKNYPETPTFKGYTIVLKNEITLGTINVQNGKYVLVGGEKWTPIGNENTPFEGTFEGGDYRIQGVYVDDDFKNSGFFGVINNGVVNELVVDGYIKGNENTGGFAGKLRGDINRCIFNGKIEGNGITGGIAGELSGDKSKLSNIYLSTASGSVETQGGNAAGGIVGYGEYGNITSSKGGNELYSFSRYTAGVVGLAGKSITVSCSDFNGVITADGNEATAGGIIGGADESFTVVNSSFGGRIHCSSFNESICGGVVGKGNGIIENSFVNAEVYSSIYFQNMDITEKKCVSAGIIGETTGATINNCYFDGISDANGLEGYWICPKGVKTNNAFYSQGIAYILYGTDDLYHVVALRESLSTWANNAGSAYSKWDYLLGINDTKPMLRHKNVAGTDGSYGWRIEGTEFTYYADGAMEDYEPNIQGTVDTPWALYRGTVRTLNIGYGVTRIGNNAFNSFEALRNIYLPTTLKEIGDFAFEYCQYLKDFTMPSSVNYIGDGAFRGCKNLTKVSIPSGVRSIRDNTFSYCEALSSVTIPQTVSYIGYMAFAACDSLVEVKLPQSVRDLEDFAFYYCDNLKTVSFPTLLGRIGEYAFGRCDNLVNLSIPLSASVGTNAFWSTLPRGDVDGDGKYTVVDYIKVKGRFMGKASLTAEQERLADCDFDGRITATDYLLVKKSIMES